jgi:hypothetical protein
MLDLKTGGRRLAELVGDAVASAEAPRVTVCSRNWALLEPLRSRPGIRALHSIGSTRQLRLLPARFGAQRLAGISIHRDLLDAPTVAGLRERTDLLLTWPVEDPHDAVRLGAWGVSGVISRDFERMTAALADAARPRAAA